MMGLHRPEAFKYIGAMLGALVGTLGGVMRDLNYLLMAALLSSPFWLPPIIRIWTRIRLNMARFLFRGR